ncbi:MULTISPECIES: DUF4426 domain-containing protein [unclassified Colwellia]|uniref:DUF4426 domain-containing protein n=1 Tax=unclassified Colwellia TaxID=196834 RepID=UPI0015F658AC|nr:MULTISPECIES: DUF4426 domain-containing protein [unclassified Colwellia]MBA6223990.1 DUF4426 domain-containing protein [Colwellia sp. MB3u-45]MBA6266547.1 DUF4426 domain-containing protein [Colwellia sp. MB3u-43]MBA6289459.1 DUF4426 domain-containing protein [Colwellia sp. MB3u-4]MBA6320171.1 DUF4426 domain-containing protein [Colwellia sp. MB02u-19]MBA6325982.1 DUF4426 domain-containing protein [Colwellia sp. MB02u-18]
MKSIINKFVLITLLALSVITTSSAENMKKMDGLNVHYIALGSAFLTPEIAKAYGIERSRYKGLVNISVLDNTQAGNPSKTVFINGKARNDVGQIKSLEFTEVKEGDAVYYLAQVSYTNKETIYFDINITDKGKQHNLKFSQKFYVD